MRLRRADGRVYLDRWGIEGRWGGLFIHRMTAPDPGVDLHDHPWTFVTFPLADYEEQRANIRHASAYALMADVNPGVNHRGTLERVRRFRPRLMRLDECHRITGLSRRSVWTIVVHGPKRRPWGFYLPDYWVHQREYGATVRAERRDMYDDINGAPT
jgi:hypothetical protein